jgi:DNA-binding transcriptional LysR family regulator
MEISSRDLRLVAMIEHHRHFGRAAEALGISQPALSRSLKALERRVGETLFLRGRAGVETTDFGRLLADRADGLLTELADLERDIDIARRQGAGSLSVAVGHFPAELSVATAVGAVLAARPKLTLTLRSQDWLAILRALKTRQVDLALCETSEVEEDSQYEVRPVGHHPVYFFTRAGHPLTRTESPGLEELLEFPWAAPMIPWRAASRFPLEGTELPAGSLEPARRVFVPRVLITSLQLAKNVVIRSDCVALGLLSQLVDELESGELELVRLHQDWMYLRYGFIWLARRRISPAATEFIDHVGRTEARLRAREKALKAEYWGSRPLGAD